MFISSNRGAAGFASASPSDYVSIVDSETNRQGFITLENLLGYSDASSSIQKFGSTFSYVNHRGGSILYPEATILAYQLSVASGADNIECDCHLLKDGTLGVMHDDTVNRTTLSTGNTKDFTAVTWKRLVINPGAALDSGWPALSPPLFAEVLQEFGNKVLIFVEAKNTGSGAAIVSALQRFGIRKDMAVVNSGLLNELNPARAAGYQTMPAPGGATTAISLKNAGDEWVATGVDETTERLAEFRAAGLKIALATPVGRSEIARLAPFCDAVFTDDYAYSAGLTPRLLTDPYNQQVWWHGAIPSTGGYTTGGRGFFVAPNKWGFNESAANTWKGALQGWAGNIGGGTLLPACTIDFSVTFNAAFATDRFAWIALSPEDDPFTTDGGSAFNGYAFQVKKNGALAAFRHTKGVSGGTSIGTATGTTVADAATATYRLTRSGTSITLARTDVVGATMTINSLSDVGPYLHAGVKGVHGLFSGFTIALT